jgi:hypothetical protein
MGVRLLEGGVALGFGAGDALIASKVSKMGPGGIPFPVYYEAAGVAAMLFGNKIGISPEVRDVVGIAALSLAGARVTRAALAGKLMSGPKAWGGDAHGGDFFSADPGTGGGGPAAAFPTSRTIRALPGGRGGGWSVSGGYVPIAEAPGVAG